MGINQQFVIQPLESASDVVKCAVKSSGCFCTSSGFSETLQHWKQVDNIKPVHCSAMGEARMNTTVAAAVSPLSRGHEADQLRLSLCAMLHSLGGKG